jgi:hypothetical protein
MQRLAHPRSKLKAMVCATIFARRLLRWLKIETRSCETKLGGQVICGDLVIGITYKLT